MVFPDTSPRGAGIEGEDDDWDFGTGAGFYLDATNQKWSKHYNMFTFLTQELPQLLGQLGLPLVGNHLYELGTGLTLVMNYSLISNVVPLNQIIDRILLVNLFSGTPWGAMAR